MSRPAPLGVCLEPGGANVAVFSAHATAIELCLFENGAERRVLLAERSGDVFHGFIPGMAEGTRYALRAHGGEGFDPERLLIDPWALALDRVPRLHASMLRGELPDDAQVPLGVVVAPEPAPSAPFVPWDATVIYELHVRGFTMRHPEVPEALRGTFAGLAHPAAIAHLQRLGVTTVELMPVCAWIEERHLAWLGLENYWGYNPVALMAPDLRLAPGGWSEIRAAVATLAAAGIETILDVVFNHSGEGDALGPTLSLRGLDAASYYRFDGAALVNDTGCGNTLALDRPIGVQLVMDAMRAWAEFGGVHGFRFDLAATMGRRPDGFDPAAPLLAAIAQDKLLSRLKLIAEPWDVGPGGYQLGRFPKPWGEWNDRFRDDIRRFWRGDGAMLGALATRLAGSQDVFGPRHRPSRSINYIVAHDGFTLADLVAHTQKHNWANAENNRDGTDANLSWNCGIEGQTDDATVLDRRAADQRALLATLLLSRGTPMLAMGSELGQTQGGNNNAYAQDNEIAWLDWSRADPVLQAWTQRLIRLRAGHAALREDRFLTGSAVAGVRPDVQWLGADGQAVDWSAWPGETLVMALSCPGDHVCLVLHRGAVARPITLPDPPDGMAWQLLADSAAPLAPPHGVDDVTASPRSVLLLGAAAQPGRARAADPAVLQSLAARAGIAVDWWEVDGTHHQVTPETLRSLLAAMHLPAETTDQAHDALAQLDRPRALPPALVRRVGEALTLPVPQTGGRSRGSLWLHIETAAGEILRHRAVVTDGWVRLPELPIGRHRVRRDDMPDDGCGVTVAPAACVKPPLAAPGFGVAAQLYTLRRAGDQGLGDFTTLRDLMRDTARVGGVAVGLNPLHALFPDRRERASPYYPSDRRFIDPIYLDLPGSFAPPDAPDIDYPAVWALKQSALAGPRPESSNIAQFLIAGGETLLRFAVFQAIAELHPRLSWQDWPTGLRDPDSAETAAFAIAHADRIAFHAALQAECDDQLAQAVAEGALPLGIIRDLAVGCAPDGAEAWALGRQLAQGPSIGAPPDPFSAEGQVWGLPPPVPHLMAEGGYASFATLLATNLRHAGGLRIDHVMGLARLFWVPPGARGRDGAYVRYPLADLLGEIALASHQASAFIIGEDLGTVPEGFRETLALQNILSYRVLLLERAGRDFLPSAGYPDLATASVSTHDLPTFLGWTQGQDISERARLGLLDEEAVAVAEREAEVAALAAALPEHTGDLVADAHAMVSQSPSCLMLIQACDLAGETRAVNLPGTDLERPNWRHRLPGPVFDGPVAARILAAVTKTRPGA